MLCIDEMREAWTDMFTHIDDLVEIITDKYPDFKKHVKYEKFQKAVRMTTKLDTILTEAQEISNKKQTKIPF